LDEKILKLVNELEEFMDDDFSTAKVLANLFDLAPIINSIKDGHIATGAISTATMQLLKSSFKIYIEDIMGLKSTSANDNSTMDRCNAVINRNAQRSKSKKRLCYIR
jgi:cysteinyl-tRNA synthetase